MTRFSLSKFLLIAFCLLPCLFMGRAEAQTFVVDPLSDTAGTLLSAHTGTTGATWTQVSALGAGTMVATTTPTGYFRATGAAQYGYLASGTPPTADYPISCNFYVAGAATNGSIGLFLRGTSGGNGYFAAYAFSNSAWVIYRVGSGSTFTNLNFSGTTTYTTGTTHALKFFASGTALTLQVDGSTVLTATDSTYTAAGQSGLSGNSTGNGTDSSGFLLSNFQAGAVATTTFYPDNAAWVVSPYNHKQSGVGASSVDISVNPGYYRRIFTTGATGASLSFSTATGTGCVVAYRWDGGPWIRANVAASVALSPPANTSVSHLLEWTFAASPITSDRWTSTPPVNAIQFVGLVLTGTVAVSAPLSRSKNVLVYGDSISEGTRVLASNSGYPVTDADASLSAYFALQDALNAEVGLVGFSGQGVVSTANSAVENVPTLPNAYNLIYSGVSRSFSQQPDLLIICEGQNDNGQSTSAFLAGLNSVVSGVGAKKSLVMGDENGYFTAQEQSVTGATFGSPATLNFSTDSYDGIHPTAAAHRAKMLPVIAAAANRLLNIATGTKRRIQ